MTADAERNNAAIAAKILRAIADLEAGTTTVEAVQAALQVAVPLLENDGSDVATAMGGAAEDLEVVLFARPLAERRSAAMRSLNQLRTVIEAAMDA